MTSLLPRALSSALIAYRDAVGPETFASFCAKAANAGSMDLPGVDAPGVPGPSHLPITAPGRARRTDLGDPGPDSAITPGTRIARSSAGGPQSHPAHGGVGSGERRAPGRGARRAVSTEVTR